MCISDDDQQCPVKCGCAPYPFKRNVTQCEKYCILFAESNDCLKWCDKQDATENFDYKLQEFEDNLEQNIQKENNNQQNQQDEIHQELVNQVEKIVNEYLNTQSLKDTFLPVSLFYNLNQHLKDCIQISEKNTNSLEIKCVQQCSNTFKRGGNSAELCQCISQSCQNLQKPNLNSQTLQQVHDPNSSVHTQNEKLRQEDEDFMNFLLNSLLSLFVTAMLVGFIGYTGMKLFQSYQQKRSVSENLLENDYLRLNGENYELVGQYNTYPNTSDPSQIKLTNQKAKLAKQHYLSLSPNSSTASRSALKLSILSGSYTKIDEEDKEYEEDEEGFKKLQ